MTQLMPLTDVIPTSFTSAVQLSDGRIIQVGTADSRIVGQYFSSDDVPQGDVFTIATLGADYDPDLQMTPTVAALSGGGFFVDYKAFYKPLNNPQGWVFQIWGVQVDSGGIVIDVPFIMEDMVGTQKPQLNSSFQVDQATGKTFLVYTRSGNSANGDAGVSLEIGNIDGTRSVDERVRLDPVHAQSPLGGCPARC